TSTDKTLGWQQTGQSSTYCWRGPAEGSIGITISSAQESQMYVASSSIRAPLLARRSASAAHRTKSSNRLLHGFSRFFQSRAGDQQRILIPVFAVEQLQRQHAAEASVSQAAKQRAQRRHPIARKNPLGV